MFFTFYPKAMGNWFSNEKEETVIIAEAPATIAPLQKGKQEDSTWTSILPYVELIAITLIIILAYNVMRKYIKKKFDKHVIRATNQQSADV